jgi:hypothetical protein
VAGESDAGWGLLKAMFAKLEPGFVWTPNMRKKFLPAKGLTFREILGSQALLHKRAEISDAEATGQIAAALEAARAVAKAYKTAGKVTAAAAQARAEAEVLLSGAGKQAAEVLEQARRALKTAQGTARVSRHRNKERTAALDNVSRVMTDLRKNQAFFTNWKVDPTEAEFVETFSKLGSDFSSEDLKKQFADGMTRREKNNLSTAKCLVDLVGCSFPELKVTHEKRQEDRHPDSRTTFAASRVLDLMGTMTKLSPFLRSHMKNKVYNKSDAAHLWTTAMIYDMNHVSQTAHAKIAEHFNGKTRSGWRGVPNSKRKVRGAWAAMPADAAHLPSRGKCIPSDGDIRKIIKETNSAALNVLGTDVDAQQNRHSRSILPETVVSITPVNVIDTTVSDLLDFTALSNSIDSVDPTPFRIPYWN